jgi:hypothetical protein
MLKIKFIFIQSIIPVSICLIDHLKITTFKIIFKCTHYTRLYIVFDFFKNILIVNGP